MLRLLVLPAALALAPVLSTAQVRRLPADAKLGRLTTGNYPEATIDGKPVRLSTGARIYSTMNATLTPSMVPPNSLVKYQLDSAGEVRNAWILDDVERQGIDAGGSLTSGSGIRVGPGN
jgi:hypothetical protein